MRTLPLRHLGTAILIFVLLGGWIWVITGGSASSERRAEPQTGCSASCRHH